MKNIVILDSKPLNPGDISFDSLNEYGNVTVYRDCPNDTGEIVERAKDAEILLICYTKITRDIIEKLPKLKYIGVLSTGYDSIDLEPVRDNGIVVTNVPAYGTDAVAQFGLALILELTTRVGYHDGEVRKGRWKRKASGILEIIH